MVSLGRPARKRYLVIGNPTGCAKGCGACLHTMREPKVAPVALECGSGPLCRADFSVIPAPAITSPMALSLKSSRFKRRGYSLSRSDFGWRSPVGRAADL